MIWYLFKHISIPTSDEVGIEAEATSDEVVLYVQKILVLISPSPAFPVKHCLQISKTHTERSYTRKEKPVCPRTTQKSVAEKHNYKELKEN